MNHGKRWKILLMLLLVGSGWMLWLQVTHLDLDAKKQYTDAETVRQAFVLSHDFDLVKEKLIETHRDHWQAYAKTQEQLRWQTGIAAGLLIVSLLLMLREFGRKNGTT